MLQLDGDGFEIEAMMNIRALQAGLKIVEVPSFEAPRVHGVGRLKTLPDGWRVLRTIGSEWQSRKRRERALINRRTHGSADVYTMPDAGRSEQSVSVSTVAVD